MMTASMPSIGEDCRRGIRRRASEPLELDVISVGMPSIRRDRRIIRRSASEPLEPDAMFARMPSIGEDRRRGIRRPASEPLFDHPTPTVLTVEYRTASQNTSSSDSSDDIRFYRYGEAKRKLERNFRLALEIRKENDSSQNVEVAEDVPRKAEMNLGFVLESLEYQPLYYMYPYDLIGRDSISEQLRGLKMLLGFVPKHQELPHVLEHVNQLRGERKKTFMCYLSPSEYS